jgi:uncharacterized membrane protein YfcA
MTIKYSRKNKKYDLEYVRKDVGRIVAAPKKEMSAKTEKKNKEQESLSNWIFYILAGSLVLAAVGFIATWSLNSDSKFNSDIFLSALMVGLVAQIVDGALGMAYGITATTFLLSSGYSPAIASASVHIAEIFTTGASGLSHWKIGNVNKKLFRALIFPGVIGGITGVFLITHMDASVVRPWIAIYLLIMGFYVFIKAFKVVAFKSDVKKRKIFSLAFFGGFIDSLGGGGWGSVVSSNLLGSGHEPRKTIGSVNAAEFFLTMSTGASFAFLIGISYWEIIAGLIVGGIVAAPIAAKITSKLPVKFLMVFVGLMIMMLSCINIYKYLF